MNRSSLLGAAMAAVLSLGVTAGCRPDAPENAVRVRLGSAAVPRTPWGDWLVDVERAVERASQGAPIDMQLHLASTLGGEREMVTELSRGETLDVFVGSLGALSSTVAPELSALELPGIFASDAEVDGALTALTPAVNDALSAHGLVLLGWAENGWLGIGAPVCIDGPDALRSVSMRAQQAFVHVETTKALGAQPIALSVPEVAGALRAGHVRAYATAPLFARSVGWSKAAKAYTWTRHIYQPAVFVTSKRALARLGARGDALRRALSAELAPGKARLRAAADKALAGMRADGTKVCPAPTQPILPGAGAVHAAFAARSPAHARFLAAVKAAVRTARRP